jgi:hypothetical protein
MPFDGTDFEPQPTRPPPPVVRDTLLCVVVFVAAIGLLVLPVSLDGLVDLVRFLSRR